MYEDQDPKAGARDSGSRQGGYRSSISKALPLARQATTSRELNGVYSTLRQAMYGLLGDQQFNIEQGVQFFRTKMVNGNSSETARDIFTAIDRD